MLRLTGEHTDSGSSQPIQKLQLSMPDEGEQLRQEFRQFILELVYAAAESVEAACEAREAAAAQATILSTEPDDGAGPANRPQGATVIGADAAHHLDSDDEGEEGEEADVEAGAVKRVRRAAQQLPDSGWELDDLTTPLLNQDLSSLTQQFLRRLDWDAEVIREAGIDSAQLNELLVMHSSWISRTIRGLTYDDHVQKGTLFLLLNADGIHKSEVPKQRSCLRRLVWPRSQAILLQADNMLKRAYAGRGFVQGHSFMYSKGYGGLYLSLLLNQLLYYMIYPDYRARNSLWELFVLSMIEKHDCGTAAAHSKIDCLLASPIVLSVIVGAPILWGMIKALLRRSEAKPITEESLNTLFCAFNEYRPHLWYDTVRWTLPRYEFQRKLDLLVRTINWDGRLTAEQRYQLWQGLRDFARQAKKNTQLEALYALTAVADGVAPYDLPKLLRAGYSQDEILQVLRIKTEAKAELREAAHAPDGRFVLVGPGLIKYVYANYLLWGLGSPRSRRWHFPFFIFKGGKIYLKVMTLITLVKGIQYAVREWQEQASCTMDHRGHWQ